MAKDIPDDLFAHLRGEQTTLALCWKIIKKNGDTILGTDHDLDIVVADGDLAGTYFAGANIAGSEIQSSEDMSVDNLEVNGSFSDSIVIPDLNADDVEAGLYNNAAVFLFFVNWASTAQGQVYLRSGWLGQLTWDSNNKYTTELRGLTQLLSQMIVETYAVDCNVVKFGDARCKLDVDAISITATVTSIIDGNREFEVSGITTESVDTYSTGVLLGLTGNNAGYTRQIRLDTTDTVQGRLTLYEAFPETVLTGDTFTMKPGCDRRYTTCRDRWGNLVNFRGPGIFIPGIDAIMKGPVAASAAVPSPSSGGGGEFVTVAGV